MKLTILIMNVSKQSKRAGLYGITVALLLANSLSASANSLDDKGLNVAKEQVNRDAGWVDAKSDIVMTLRSADGEEYSREIEISLMEVENDGDKSMVTFQKPLDIKGTAFLTFSHIEKSDEQWLYIPAIKRIKRINAKNKSGPFMGSEFSYEDMSSFEYQDYSFKYLRFEDKGGLKFHVVEQVPLDKYSGYSKRIVWIDDSEYRTYKIEYYDRRGDLLKTLANEGFKRYLDKFWRPELSKMVNHKTGKSTDLSWSDYSFRNGFSSSDFNKSALK